MKGLIRKLYNVLLMIKDFTPGYTTACKDKMIVYYKDEAYVLALTKIEEPSENPMDDINKYLR